jgi:hypothetical protein
VISAQLGSPMAGVSLALLATASAQSLSIAGYEVRTNTLQWTSGGVTYTNDGPTQ